MAEAKKDPQEELAEMIAAQKLLAEEIITKRAEAREAALTTIKKLYEAHEFQYKDVKEFIKATPRKRTPAKKVPAAKKR
jgi:hypothetical protein